MTESLLPPVRGFERSATVDGLLLTPSANAGDNADVHDAAVRQLLEQGLAEEVSRGRIRVAWPTFFDSLEIARPVLAGGLPQSAYGLRVVRDSDLGRRDFRISTEFTEGGRPIALERVGPFVRRVGHDETSVLEREVWEIVEATQRLGENANTLQSQLDVLRQVQERAPLIGATLDDVLSGNRVLVPETLRARLHEHEDGSVSIVPATSGVPDDAFATAYLRNPTETAVFRVDLGPQHRLNVLLTERHSAVIRAMRRQHRLRGDAAQKLSVTPEAPFDGLLGDVEITYGPRVVGVGPLPDVPDARPPGTGLGLAPPATPAGDRATFGERDRQRIVAQSPNGDRVVVRVPPQGHAPALDAIEEALGRGETTIALDGVTVRITPELVRNLGGERRSAAPHTKFLLIHTNATELQPHFESQVPRAAVGQLEALPSALRSDISLHAHQREAFEWFWRCVSTDARRGFLLADDMGTGKTLQVLNFLASWIERGGTSVRSSVTNEASPWRPVLIVMPKLLLDTETWQREMKRFFRHDGAIFEPVLVLHGSELSRLRTAAGAEVADGKPRLDVERLRNNRVVLTTYDVVVNYQHSLAQMIEGESIWSVVVADEAQEYKDPNTKRSWALKALHSDVFVACTGTPVENRLRDVWNIVDAAQSGLLKTAAAFTAQYEKPLMDTAGDDPIPRLRDALAIGKPNAVVLRREKDRLELGLPKLGHRRIDVELSPEEVDLHRNLVASMRGGAPGSALAAIHRLSDLSQYIGLLDDSWPGATIHDALARSSKLRAVIDVASEIARAREKLVLFARRTPIQQLLAVAIQRQFGNHVDIINGVAARAVRGRTSADSRAARMSRSAMLDRFRSTQGFAAIVLSPDVAGTGLTINEANHVVHYGRWWNPAVEDQATARVYRIGQTRPVTVYTLIAHAPARSIVPTFDEALDGLLERKRKLAADFLRPTTTEGENTTELFSTLTGNGADTPSASTVVRPIDLLPSEFEAGVAAMFLSEGSHVVLTPISNDGGVDVAAISPTRRILAQVKLSRGSLVGTDAVADTVAGLERYRPALGGGVWQSVLVTNAELAGAALQECRTRGVDVLSGADFARRWAEAGITRQRIAAVEAARAPTIAAAIAEMRRAVNAPER